MARYVLIFCLLPIASLAADVPWLEEVQRSPENGPKPVRKLAPLMTDEDLQSNDALTRWRNRRSELLRVWQQLLGPMPERPKSNTFEVLDTTHLDTLTRQRIRYENEPGQFLEAYLLQPSNIRQSERRPGLIALHATTDRTNEPIAGVGGRDDEQLGLKLAMQGFVVICPKNFLWQDAKSLNDAVAQFRQRHPGTLGMQKMLYDAQRATDILASLANVDSERLGAVGHSLGAKEVLYLTAFDNRISAAVFSEGGLSFESTNWQAPWYLGPIVQRDDFPRNHHELVALIAPRPFLVLGGETGPGAADGDRSWPYLVSARPIYELYGAPPRFGLLNHHEGHAISSKSFDRLSEWLRTYLRLKSE